jgi:DNA-binding beta-propeller fold protein YncE
MKMNIKKTTAIIIFLIGLFSSFAQAKSLLYLSNPNPGIDQITIYDITSGGPFWLKKVSNLNSYPGYTWVTPDSSRAYAVTGEKIAIIDPQTSSQIDSIELRKDFTHYIRQLAVTSDSKKLYVIGLNYETALLATVDLTTRKVINKLPLSVFNEPLPEALSITPDGKTALVLMKSKSAEAGVVFIDLVNQKISQIVRLPGVGHRLVMTPDGKKAYIPIHSSGYRPYDQWDMEGDDIEWAGDSMSNLIVIDVDNRKIKTTLPITGTGDITLSQDSKTAYMLATSNVTVIDTASDTIIDYIPVNGGKHYRIAITPDKKYSYIADYTNYSGDLILRTDLKSKESMYYSVLGANPAESITFVNQKD